MQLQTDNFNDIELDMIMINLILELEMPDELPLEFQVPAAPLHDLCPAPSQQSLPFPPTSVGPLAPPKYWQPWAMYPSSCVPTKVEIQDLAELCLTTSYEKPSYTVPKQVEAPMSWEDSHSSTIGQQGSVQPKKIANVTKYSEIVHEHMFVTDYETSV